MPCSNALSPPSCWPCSPGWSAASSDRTSPRKPIATLTLCAVLAIVFVSGSGCSRPVLIPDDSPIRTGPDVRGRAYLLINGVWQLTISPVTYPEGWYVVPPRFIHPDDFPSPTRSSP